MGTSTLERAAVIFRTAALISLLGCSFTWGVPSSASEEKVTARPPDSRPSVIVVIGAEGEPEFGEDFAQQADVWRNICERANAHFSMVGVSSNAPAASAPATPGSTQAVAITVTNVVPEGAELNSTNTFDHDQIQEILTRESKEGHAELWLILVGHGTFDGKEAKLNLRGTDVSATELASWLKPFRRPVIVVNTASSSGPFLPMLAGDRRVVVTATRSGYEQNYTRFGRQFAEALLDPQSDLDQDGQTSLLEGFLSASFRVADFYKTEGRLATEHALLDDNGDGLGTPAEWFRGLRATKRPRDNAPLDGLHAHQFHLIRSEAEAALSPEVRARRDEMELQIAHLRESKANRPEDEYYRELEALLLDLAKLYETAKAGKEAQPGGNSQ